MVPKHSLSASTQTVTSPSTGHASSHRGGRVPPPRAEPSPGPRSACCQPRGRAAGASAASQARRLSGARTWGRNSYLHLLCHTSAALFYTSKVKGSSKFPKATLQNNCSWKIRANSSPGTSPSLRHSPLDIICLSCHHWISSSSAH